MDFSRASWAVRAYYRIWLALPYCRQGMIGAGVYGLSKAGRARFSEFPNLIADDGYIRALFAESERGKVEGAYSVVRAPASLRWLMKIKVRSRLGQKELALKYPNLLTNEQKDYGGGLRQLLGKPLLWPAAVVYLYVAVGSRWRAQKQLKKLDGYQWDRDLSSRN
ncbi:hypothetical protein [Alkalilimnicola ehrlichii]|nr:hypothetical protein [Alkalilimnicola ehrlichii]